MLFFRVETAAGILKAVHNNESLPAAFRAIIVINIELILFALAGCFAGRHGRTSAVIFFFGRPPSLPFSRDAFALRFDLILPSATAAGFFMRDSLNNLTLECQGRRLSRSFRRHGSRASLWSCFVIRQR